MHASVHSSSSFVFEANSVYIFCFFLFCFCLQFSAKCCTGSQCSALLFHKVKLGDTGDSNLRNTTVEFHLQVYGNCAPQLKDQYVEVTADNAQCKLTKDIEKAAKFTICL